jgi:hypothetical protein
MTTADRRGVCDVCGQEGVQQRWLPVPMTAGPPVWQWVSHIHTYKGGSDACPARRP